ncbi:MAG: esterase/lipase family protein [Pseudonocardiaceae bacterium]
MSTVGWGSSRVLRGWPVRVMLATLVLVTATAISSPAPVHADTRYPVLLLHGGLGRPSDLNQMAIRLIADGYRPYTVDLGLGVDTVGNAERIKAKVKQIRDTTRAPKVHLVGHSMGGLSPRYYIKILGGLPYVATYTAFGTPQHGHPPGCPTVADQCPKGPVLTELNRDDDTPGPIHYTSIASRQAHPEEANGQWHPLDQGACLPVVDGGPHRDEPNNAMIYQAVKDGLNSTCPSGLTNLPEITP